METLVEVPAEPVDDTYERVWVHPSHEPPPPPTKSVATPTAATPSQAARTPVQTAAPPSSMKTAKSPRLFKTGHHNSRSGSYERSGRKTVFGEKSKKKPKSSGVPTDNEKKKYIAVATLISVILLTVAIYLTIHMVGRYQKNHSCASSGGSRKKRSLDAADLSQLMAISSGNRQLRQVDKKFCRELDQTRDDVQKVIDAQCDTLTSTIDYNLLVKEVVKENWEKFTSQLDRVEVNITIDDSTIDELKMPKLTSTNIRSFVVTNNTALKTISIKMARNVLSIANLVISNNALLTSTNITAVVGGFAGGITVSNNKNLATLALEVSKIFDDNQNGVGLIIENNPALHTIKMEHIGVVNIKGQIRIFKNMALMHVKIPNATHLAARNGMEISKNDNLTNIHLDGQFTVLTTAKLTIKQNVRLAWLSSMPKLKSAPLKIRGNPRLPQEMLQELNKTDSDIQAYGECMFDDPISDLSHLANCHFVSGNLNFVNGANGSAGSSKLTQVTGNINLAGLDPKQVEFLKDTDVTGTIKSDVCEFSGEMKKKVESPPCLTTPSTTTTTTTTDGPSLITRAPGGSRGTGNTSDPSITSTCEPESLGVVSGVLSMTWILILCAIGGMVMLLWTKFNRGVWFPCSKVDDVSMSSDMAESGSIPEMPMPGPVQSQRASTQKSKSRRKSLSKKSRKSKKSEVDEEGSQ